MIGDSVFLYKQSTDDMESHATRIEFKVVSGSDDSSTVFTCKSVKTEGRAITIASIAQIDDEYPLYRLFTLNDTYVPTYAEMLWDGTCRYVWRNLIPNGFNKDNPMDLSYPFTNGALYVNKSINLFVRRQDPQGIYGLYTDKDPLGIETDFETENTYYKAEDIEC